VIFEKEGIDTLETDDETLLIIFSALAQKRANPIPRMSACFRQMFKAGKVPYHAILDTGKGRTASRK
jgi:hypothetical protein